MEIWLILLLKYINADYFYYYANENKQSLLTSLYSVYMLHIQPKLYKYKLSFISK